MAELQTILVAAVRSVIQRQQLLTANLTANAFLLFVLYSLFVINRVGAVVSDTLLVVVPTAFFLCWLQATTLAAFYPDQAEIPFIPALRRLHYFAPWAAGVVGVVMLFSWMSSLIGFWVWVVGVACLIVLLPLAAQAAGGWFERSVAINVIFDPKYWLLATGMLIVGLYLPFLIFFSLPVSESILVQMTVNGLRVGISYLLAISAWVTLAAIIGELTARASAQSEGADVARLSEGTSDGTQTVTPKRSFNRNAITME
jgi:hypothetical protein